jgi:hypothetical protein
MGPIETTLAVGATAAAVPLAKDMLTRLLGPSADFLGEKLKGNLVAVLGKAKTMANEAGVELEEIPARTGVPLAQAAALDDDEMQRRWAALLFNAGNPNSKTEVRTAFPVILRELSPAKLLDGAFDYPRAQARGNGGAL